MHGYIQRDCFQSILYKLKRYPVVTLLGSRQVGKSTLAKKEKTRGYPFLLYLMSKEHGLQKNLTWDKTSSSKNEKQPFE